MPSMSKCDRARLCEHPFLPFVDIWKSPVVCVTVNCESIRGNSRNPCSEVDVMAGARQWYVGNDGGKTLANLLAKSFSSQLLTLKSGEETLQRGKTLERIRKKPTEKTTKTGSRSVAIGGVKMRRLASTILSAF